LSDFSDGEVGGAQEDFGALGAFGFEQVLEGLAEFFADEVAGARWREVEGAGEVLESDAGGCVVFEEAQYLEPAGFGGLVEVELVVDE